MTACRLCLLLLLLVAVDLALAGLGCYVIAEIVREYRKEMG